MRNHRPWATAAVALLLLLPTHCTGPQPLTVAIQAKDQSAYVSALNAANGDAHAAFVAWMTQQRNARPAYVLEADRALSETRNPFDAHRDRRAVSRGAVIYKAHCARCHGDDARGHGPSTLRDYPATDFKTLGKRLAATLHRGAPRKWYRVIRDGTGEVIDYPDGPTTAMPPFGEAMTREQIWLAITYLQSLDMHARRSNERNGGRTQ